MTEKNAGVVRSRNNKERSFAPVTSESMRQRMTIRTNKQLQYVLARIGNAAKNNCGRIRCSQDALGQEAREFLANKLGYSVTFITEKDKYEVRRAGSANDDEEEKGEVEIDPSFAEG